MNKIIFDNLVKNYKFLRVDKGLIKLTFTEKGLFYYNWETEKDELINNNSVLSLIKMLGKGNEKGYFLISEKEIKIYNIKNELLIKI